MKSEVELVKRKGESTVPQGAPALLITTSVRPLCSRTYCGLLERWSPIQGSGWVGDKGDGGGGPKQTC